MMMVLHKTVDKSRWKTQKRRAGENAHIDRDEGDL